MTQHQPLVILASGGTGGHVFPAEALAQELISDGYRVMLVTDKRGEIFKNIATQIPVKKINAATMKPGLVAKLRAVLDMGIGVLQALWILQIEKPALVVGFGGYPSFPTVFAAQVKGILTLIHEQNGVLGKANVWLSVKATRIATSLLVTKGIRPQDEKKVTVTGSPVRANMAALKDVPYTPFTADGVINIFVTGGSQAAKIFSEVIPAAVSKLPPSLKSRLKITQQCRESDLAACAELYKSADVTPELKAFFNDMPARLGACHLFIGRGGASTVAEAAIAGRPAIFVPLPGHADQQQKINAEVIANRGGGWVIEQKDLTADVLAKKLLALTADPSVLAKAASSSRACGQTGGARNLANLVKTLINR